VPNLRAAAPALSALSHLFDMFGTDDSGFYMEMIGRAPGGQPLKIVFDLTARAGDGLMIPCTPAIALALKLANGEMKRRGAMPCFGLLELDDILHELRPLRVTWEVSRFW
jgi:hypothetical protein